MTTGAPDPSYGADGEIVLSDQALSPYGVDVQGRSYDAGIIDRPFSPVGVVQRRSGS